MIGILAQGRLGNQMFQYAFIYAASKKRQTAFFMRHHNALHYFNLYDDLLKNNTINTLKFAARNITQKSRYPITRQVFKQPFIALYNWAIFKNILIWDNFVGSDKQQSYLLNDVKNNVLYEGFFQSEDYFKDYETDIKTLFSIKNVYKTAFLKQKADLFKRKTIILHIRRTDYNDFEIAGLGGKNLTLPLSYYHKCLALIENIDTYNVVFVSDDMDFVRQEFPEKANYFYESNDEIIDFQILLNADILIIANSSFSWWAAWLNPKQDKIIYAPQYFLGFKVNAYYPMGIKVDAWQWIDVY